MNGDGRALAGVPTQVMQEKPFFLKSVLIHGFF
jgi:hypothetical protein